MPCSQAMPVLHSAEGLRVFASLQMCGASSGSINGVLMPPARRWSGPRCACSQSCWGTCTTRQFALVGTAAQAIGPNEQRLAEGKVSTATALSFGDKR